MSLEGPFDPFEALGLERDATPSSIKAEYYKLARRYHPSRSRCSDEALAGLSDHFHNVHQAWKLLCDPNSRRRCIEVLQLHDLEESVLASVVDLLYEDEHADGHPESRSPVPGSHTLSDADDDDDLPRVAGLKRRQTFDQPSKRKTGGLGTGEDGSDSSEEGVKRTGTGSRVSHLQSGHRTSRHEDDSSDNANTAAERRRRFDKLRRKEYTTFNIYKEMMQKKFEAEAEAQRAKEEFEHARWRRAYYERAPKDSTQRVRLLKLFNTAAKALITQRPARRRHGSSLSTVQGTPTESTGMLGLPSRMKSVHRRGMSSDVTGDQTSSDEDTSDRNPSPHRSPRARSPRPGRFNHHRWNSLPKLSAIAPQCLPNGTHDPISPITGPGPKLLIRAPSNLNEMAALTMRASDADSATESSRSVSPHPSTLKKNDSGRFVIVPSNRATDLFGDGEGHRSRSRSADRRFVSGSGKQISSAEVFHFRLKQIGHLRHHCIPVENVHMLTFEEKQWMLGVDPDADMDPDTLLKRVSRLDARVADSFMVKPDIKARFNFRLVYGHPEVAKQPGQSFIALSYRRKLQVQRRDDHYTLPLMPEMFQAVWDERSSDYEGVWIDQVCIGDTTDEKTISMSAMDMVYRSARLVVVALDDVLLEAHECETLEAHMAEFDRQVQVPANKRFRRRQTPYLESHDDLYVVIRKLMRSSWFQRAWCRHEMRLGREHIFLVPCQMTECGTGVLRFTGKCLTHFLGLATEVLFEQTIESTKAALYAFFRDRSKLQAHEEMRSHHGNFTTVVAEVFAMQAGGDPKIPEAQREADARKDKISIILNTMECGLALAPEMRDISISLPEHECYYMLNLLALAARDPGALGTVGRPLRSMPYGLTSSWLLEPTNVDAGLNNYRTLNRLPERSRITNGFQNNEHFVQLELKLIDPDNAFLPTQSKDTLELAKHFMSVCARRHLGRNRKRYLLSHRALNRLFGSMRDIYIETLVCVFECGPIWMSDVCERYGVSRWRSDLEPAACLLIALKNTAGRWPESAWSNQAAGFTMDFVNFLIVRGLPHRQIVEPEMWRPVWVPTPKGGRVVTFAPREGSEVRVAVPVALFDPDYMHVARLWVLQPRAKEGEGRYDEWTLLGKSVLFSDDVAIEVLEMDNGLIRRNQRVFGRQPEEKVEGAVGGLKIPG